MCGLVPDHAIIFSIESPEDRIYWRKLLELFPFFSQCVLIPGMALERWLLVCRPTQSAAFLKGTRKYTLYIGLPLLSLCIPLYLYSDFLLYQSHPVQPSFPTFPPPCELLLMPNIQHCNSFWIYHNVNVGILLIQKTLFCDSNKPSVNIFYQSIWPSFYFVNTRKSKTGIAK